MSRYPATLMLLALMAISPRLHAQVSPASSKPFSTYVYGMASGSEHEMNFGHALGGTGGVVLQHSRWMALDFRGVALPYRVPLHTYIAEVGPRVSHRYGPMRPYGELLVGLGHSGYRLPQNNFGSGYGLAFSGDFGADLRVAPRLYWRVAEFSYSHISAGPGESPVIHSTGAVFRLF